MRKSLAVFIIMLFIVIISSCSELYDPLRDANVPWDTGGSTFGIYCEDVPISIIWDTDAKMDIWQGIGISDQSAVIKEGTKAWQLVSSLNSWIGMGIRVNPITSSRDLSQYDGGKIHFDYKGTRGFKVGIKSVVGTNAQEAWVRASLMTAYGLQTNDTWCEVNIPISALIYDNPYLDLANINQFFMWVDENSQTGTVYYLDGIYWSKDYYGPAADHYTPTNFGLYSDTVENSVLWDNNCKLDIWSDYDSGMELTNIQTNAFEGLNCWKMTGTGTNWTGMGIRFNPVTEYNDMSEYALGALHFAIKGTNSFSVGIKSGTANKIWITSSQLSNLGYLPDGNWHELTIPMTNFSGIDFTHISQYFMFMCDASLGYDIGIVFYLDNIYWSLTN